MRRAIGIYGSTIPTDREEQIMELVASGLKNKTIGEQLGISEMVVKNYLRVIYDKLGVWNRVELTLRFLDRKYKKET